MESALIFAVCSICFEYVAVSGFQFPIYRAFLYSSRSDIVGQHTQEQCIHRFEVVENADELVKVFAQKRISLPFTHSIPTEIFFTGQFSMTVAQIWPVAARIMQGLMVLDNKNGSLKRRQLHNVPLCGESRRCDGQRHYRQKEYQDFSHRIIGVTGPTIGSMILPPSSSLLSLPLNSKVCSHGVELKLFSITIRSL